jgi:uncharacterized damage-inducible protein DinB
MGENDVTAAGTAEVLALAEATPRRLALSTAGMDDARLCQPPAPGEWSALDILNHLRACEEVWMHSVQAMLAHDTPSLKEIHPRQWIRTLSPYTTQSFASSLQIFTLRREALMITLRALSPADWAREGRLDRQTRTVYSHVRRMVQHEEVHCDQIDPQFNVKSE